MSKSSSQTSSLWMTTADMPSQSSLSEHQRADVCVVGAGIAGLSVAYCLAREGKSVVLVHDGGQIGGGMTERTTAHLSNVIDDGYTEIERLHGDEGAQLVAQSHGAAIDFIETTIAKEGIECDFERVDGYLFVPPGESRKSLEDELEAAHRAGLTDAERLDRTPVESLAMELCVRFPRQAQFHPLKYLAGLGHAIGRRGGRIFGSAHVQTVEGGAPARVETDKGHLIRAEAVVIATNTPISDIVTIHTKQAPYTTYVIGARLPRGALKKALYWDTLDPYHYVRIHPLSSKDGGDYDVLIVGGEDHKTGQADDGDHRYVRLEMWARDRFPAMGRIEFRWSGQVMEPVDGLAFIGRDPGNEQNVYVATGDSGMGLTHGTIAGLLLTDLIMGRDSSWASLYDPSRKTLRAAGTYVQESVNVAVQYADWVTGGDVSSEEEIGMDSGAIVRHGLKKVAAYRDQKGVLHRCSAVCPHLNCIVGWNNTEKTWDCPCHGSRFDKFGKVINGPAIQNLGPVKDI